MSDSRTPAHAAAQASAYAAGPQASAYAAAETAAREAYGRLLAWLAWQWRDIAAAEDALAEALASALEHWPREGVPLSPQGWLLTTAKRNLLKAARRTRLAEDPTVTVLFPTDADFAAEAPDLPDDRLRLMFVCTHPAIDAGVRSALMLQTVLGLDAARIARAFVISPEAMTKRLTRAKAKIKATGLRFEEPDGHERPQRLQAVLEAIYAAYTLHWDHPQEGQAGELAGEAMFLAELAAATPPPSAEALGLAALLLLCEARRPARIDAQGAFVPLPQQDVRRWNRPMIERANALLAAAAQQSQPGPYQLEAAIQSAHASRLYTGATPWVDIVQLYERLLATSPTIGAHIGHAIAVAQACNDPQAGLALLDSLSPRPPAHHQPWWAARAFLLAEAGATAEAAAAYAEALAHAQEPVLRRYLQERLTGLRGCLH